MTPEPPRPWLTRRRVRAALRWTAVLLGLTLGALALLLVYGAALVDAAFATRSRVATPVVLSSPLRLHAGEPWTPATLAEALRRRGVPVSSRQRPRVGEAAAAGSAVLLAPGLVEGGGEVTLLPGPGGLRIQDASGRERAAAVLPGVVISVVATSDTVRWPVPLDAVSSQLVTAVVDVEDRSFLSHAGLSLRGLVRAALRDLVAGGVRQGGSTITQQLAKIMLLKPSRTVPRKVLEAWLAGLIEYRYDKRTILETYLNRVYLGQDGGWQIQGVVAAAHFYFGKGVGHLEPEEAALLAGLIAAPNRYDPFDHPASCRERRLVVLNAMVRAGHLQEGEAARLAGQPLPEAPRRFRWAEAAHAVEAVLSGAPAAPELRTFVDPDLQVAVNEGSEAALAELEGRHRRLRELSGLGDPLQVAVVALAPDGGVLALRGSRTGAWGEFNRATSARRSIGSLVKPFVVSTALQQGWSLELPLQDEPLVVPVGSEVWEPKNSDGTFRGSVTVREALVSSLNVPAVRLGLEVGLDNVVATLRGVGFELPAPTPATLLGAFAATPLQVARAYAAIGNQGRLPGVAVREPVAAAAAVLDAGVATAVLGALEEVPLRGTAAALAGRVEGPLACKTGTTDERRDSWFVALRPRLVVAVWVGTDGNRETGLYGATGAMEVWRAIDARMPAVWKGRGL